MGKRLVLKNVSKQFKGLRAVQNFSAVFEDGKIYGLIGTNGAGKSTIINMISGSCCPSEGEIYLDEKRIDCLPANLIARSGIARTFQNLRLFKKMTVLENVMAAAQKDQKYGLFSLFLNLKGYRQTEEKIKADALRELKKMGIEKYKRQQADSLAYGYQRRLEIARCLASKPEVLLLDEPAAGMNPSESAQLVEDIKKINTERNITIVLIEHDMKVVMKLCEYIYVMASGEIIAEGTPEEIRKNPKVIQAYLGGEEKHAGSI